MLKYALVLVLAVAFTTAMPRKRSESGSGSEEMDGPKLSAASFRDEIKKVRDTSVGLSKNIDGVKELALKALSDPSGDGWEEFGDAMGYLVNHVSHNFDREMDNVAKLVEALWEDHTTFVKDNKCGFVAALDKTKESSENIEMEFVMAMIEDLGCLAQEFAAAKELPVDMITDQLHENDAIEITSNLIWSMRKIGRAGEQFGESMKSVSEYIEVAKKK